MSTLIVILGPTASGKTNLAIRLAKKFNGEIISADSRTIYKGMMIGTASPCQQSQKSKGKSQNYADFIEHPRCRQSRAFSTKSERSRDNSKLKKNKTILIKKIPHHLLHIIYPNQKFTVAQFKRRAIKIIKDIQRRKKIPFLVGGTGLYVSTIVDNWQIPKVKPDYNLRGRLEKQNLKKLWQKLIYLDPESKNFVQPSNRRRVIRALEVCLKTKKPFSSLRKKAKPLFKTLLIGINLPRKILYQRIAKRIDQMIKGGLIEETKNLAKNYSFDLPSMSGLGYRQIGMYLGAEISLEEAIELIKKETKHYSRRQMTWFKRDERINWIKNFPQAEKIIKKFLTN